MRTADWGLRLLLGSLFGTAAAAAATNWLSSADEVFVVDVALCILSLPLLLLRLRVIVRLQYLLLQPAWALVKDGQELFRKLLNLVQICIRIDVRVPCLPL